MERGVWNILNPADTDWLTPNVVIAPLVGFDPGCFRLGYGGGFFDRTLAALTHLSGLSGYVVPLGGAVVPIVIWAVNKESPVISSIAKQALLLNVVVYLLIAATIISVIAWFIEKANAQPGAEGGEVGAGEVAAVGQRLDHRDQRQPGAGAFGERHRVGHAVGGGRRAVVRAEHVADPFGGVCPFERGMRHGQHRTRRLAQHLLGYRAEHQPFHAAAAVRADHDEIGAPVARGVECLVHGAAVTQFDVHGETRPAHARGLGLEGLLALHPLRLVQLHVAGHVAERRHDRERREHVEDSDRRAVGGGERRRVREGGRRELREVGRAEHPGEGRTRGRSHETLRQRGTARCPAAALIIRKRRASAHGKLRAQSGAVPRRTARGRHGVCWFFRCARNFPAGGACGRASDAVAAARRDAGAGGTTLDTYGVRRGDRGVSARRPTRSGASMLPVDVVFLHVRRSAAAETNIRARAEELAALFPSITRCRVLVEVPARHHTTGKRFRVRIELAMLRREDIVVERGPAGRGPVPDDDKPARHKADEVDGAFTDIGVVVHGAFDAARKRLQTIEQRRRATARARAVRAKAKTERSVRARRGADD